MEEGEAVDVIYLDFAKAFDKVDHGILLQKLQELGIGHLLLRWIRNFLFNRTQCVAIEGVESQPIDVISGVPQGTVLGPLLFLIHIGDIDQELQHSKASTFADDTKVMKVVDSPQDAENLQLDLDRIYRWADTNNMQLNGDKFRHLRYGEAPGAISYKTQTGNSIEQVSEVVDLGVVMEDSGKFDNQVRTVAQKGKRNAGWALRVFQTRQEGPMLILLKTLVLSMVEYCSALWSPQKLGLIREIENVQRAFTRRISGLENLNYETRLKRLNLFSLERRRDRFRVIYVWRIINGLSPNLDDVYKIQTRYNSRRGLECIIPNLSRSSRALQTTIEESFAIAGPRAFNSINKELRCFTGKLDTFKANLDKFLWQIPDNPVLVGHQQSINCNRLDVRVHEFRRSLNNPINH